MPSAKKASAEEMLTELSMHATIEEIFCAACKDKGQEEVSSESYVEHDSAKVLTAELAHGSSDDVRE